MSAMVGYYNALTDEIGARAAQDRQQAALTGQQVQSYDADDYARRQQELGAASASFGSGKLSTAQAAVTPEEADSRAAANNASANLSNQQASTLRQKTPFELALDNMNIGRLGLENTYYGPQQDSLLRGAAIDQAGAAQRNAFNGSYGGSLRRLQPGLFGDQSTTLGALTPEQQQSYLANQLQFHAKGTAKIKANDPKATTPQPTDTVPAMLSPGEAVLNKGAVDHYGGAMITHMNNIGLLRQAAEQEHGKLLKKMKARPKKKAA